MQLVDVLSPVDATTRVIYDQYNLKYFLFDFTLQNQAVSAGGGLTGDVDIQAQESADGATWSNVGAAVKLVPDGSADISVQCVAANFRLTVKRSTGSNAVGVVKGTLKVPDWMADRQLEVRVDTVCKAACQNDCQLKCEGSCEAGCQTACELTIES